MRQKNKISLHVKYNWLTKEEDNKEEQSECLPGCTCLIVFFIVGSGSDLKRHNSSLKK